MCNFCEHIYSGSACRCVNIQICVCLWVGEVSMVLFTMEQSPEFCLMKETNQVFTLQGEGEEGKDEGVRR